METIQRNDLGSATDLAGNAGRVARVAEIDAAIEAWTLTRSVAEVLATPGEARVPAGQRYSAKGIHQDPHYRETRRARRLHAADAALGCHVVTPAVSKQAQQWDPVKDFVPVANVLSAPQVIVVRAGLPVKTLAELTAHVKANPGKPTYASSGNGSLQHVTAR